MPANCGDPARSTMKTKPEKKSKKVQASDLKSKTAAGIISIADSRVDEPKSAKDFPIVGIGASAGGLAAFEAFFSAMPPVQDTNMAFVLIQHLSPDHKSALTELVGRYTRMPVEEVVDGVEVKPNHVYI